MTVCDEVKELLCDYINRGLTPAQNSAVVRHMAQCPECRTRLAVLLLLQKQVRRQMTEVPPDIVKSAFALLPKEEETTVPVSCFMAFDLLRHHLEPVRQTIELVRVIL